ncbi:MAG: DUF692 domain-containing protein [Gammaproteobacteria bacterium]
MRGLNGTGLGLRRPLIEPLLEQRPAQLSFLEVAPENWLGIGGRLGRQLRALSERYPLASHGLSLSLGGPGPLDEAFVLELKRFFDEYGITTCSEHLSYCSDDGQLYDLLPIPFTEEAVHWVAARIRRVEALLERPLAIENVSYYAAPGAEMREIEFVNAVLEEADCRLLLDVNNVLVNSVNHAYDPVEFIHALPADRVEYLHMAGHTIEAEDLRIDTHGSDVPDEVWRLLAVAYAHCGPLPTLLERDFNIPPLDTLLAEVDRIVEAQRA